MSKDLFTQPEWQAIARECKLSRQLIGSGATALSSANYADKKGDYYVAFFGLSIGLERLLKIILVTEYAVENDGKLPDQKVVRKFGHNLKSLLEKVSEIEKKYSLNVRFKRPSGPIQNAIIDCLDSFADAQRGRYANYDTIGDPNLGQEFEPIRKWWSEVAEPVLSAHFYGKIAEKNVRSRAQLADALLQSFTLVLHFKEDGGILRDVESASFLTGATKYVQKYSRYYTLTIVRWVSCVFSELSRYGCYSKKIEALFGHYEHFQTYTVEDEFLKSRKKWPL